MHYCSIIIKDKRVSVEEARTIVGDKLVSLKKADWYSTGDYRERTFGDKQTISLEKFKDIYKKEWLGEEYAKDKTMWDFGVVVYDKDYGNYLSIFIEENEFWEFTRFRNPTLFGDLRERLIDLYYEAYKIHTLDIIDELLRESYNDYNVVLLDYHN